MMISMRILLAFALCLICTASTVIPGAASAQEPVVVEVQELDPTVAAMLAANSVSEGNPGRGAVVFASPTSACLSCHKVGGHGGEVGPDLSQIATQRKLPEIIESLWAPQRVVADAYKAIAVLTIDGQVIRGYRVSETDDAIEIRDTAGGKAISIDRDDVEAVQEVGSLMPTGLLATMTDQDKYDLIAFLAELGHHRRISLEAIDSLFSHTYAHHPESFDMPRQPLEPDQWPSWQASVNRDRIYDFYRKQARHFRDVQPRPALLTEFPGLDGGSFGHWGNQSEPVWADGRWNETDLGSLLSGVFHGEGVSVARGICVRLSDGDDGLSVCFDAETLSYPRVWSGGFVRFTEVRHGFMAGLNQFGETVSLPASVTRSIESADTSADDREYLGLYRHGRRVLFSYRIGDTVYLDAPMVVDGQFQRVVAPLDQHPDRDLLRGGPPQWPQEISTQGTVGSGSPYAVDTITLPADNPWKALIYCGGHDFLSDGSAMLCTMQGDVWRATGIDADLKEVVWRRFASGLDQALGLVVNHDQVYVIGRDQLTLLHDLNDDGEADFYQSFSHTLGTSKSGHDFTCGLQRDAEGRFYTASGLEGVMRISSGGSDAQVLATGLRNSDGIGLTPDGLVTIPSSEGDWVPASMIAAIRPDGAILNRLPGTSPDFRLQPFFGRPGTNLKQPPEVPMLYLPRGLDNSSGGQVFVDSDRWGPVQGQMVHLSFGGGRAFLLLRDEFDDWIQGAVVPIAGEFASGVHRGRFNPVDGQLYVSGMAGWGTYTTDDGCFQRVRFTGTDAQLPVSFHAHQNGIRVTFSEPLDQTIAEDPDRHFAQAWNYRFSGAYGSPEYSHRQLGLRGHDVLTIASATVLEDDRSLFLEIPDLQLVNQLHLLVQTSPGSDHDLFLTLNRLDDPFDGFPSYRPHDKVLLPHPMLADLRRPIATKRNPYGKAIADARSVTIAAARNLMFDQPVLEVEAGEPIRLTFNNPDAVPHNWALIKPGTLQSVGQKCNQLIADPEAVARHYIPDTDEVLGVYRRGRALFRIHDLLQRAADAGPLSVSLHVSRTLDGDERNHGGTLAFPG